MSIIPKYQFISFENQSNMLEEVKMEIICGENQAFLCYHVCKLLGVFMLSIFGLII